MPPNRVARPWDAATPDEELVVWTQRGQRAAFGVLYDRYLTTVHGYGWRVLGEREAAQDAASAIFINALAALPRYRAGGTAGSFRSWLFTIAHNVLADELRARRDMEPLTAAQALIDHSPSPEALAIAADERHVVAVHLPRLSPDQRHVIGLRLAGLTAAEIGDVLGRPRNAIDGIHHRALRRLQALVAASSAPAPANGGTGHD